MIPVMLRAVSSLDRRILRRPVVQPRNGFSSVTLLFPVNADIIRSLRTAISFEAVSNGEKIAFDAMFLRIVVVLSSIPAACTVENFDDKLLGV